MRKSYKAAAAAIVGTGLVLGGLGSLAYWQDDEAAEGGTITSGSLDLGAPVCGDWVDAAGEVVDLATFRIVPGDVLTRSCDFEIELIGDNLQTALTFASPDLDASVLAGELDFAASYAVGADAPLELADDDADNPTVTTLADGDTISVDYAVELPFGGNEADAPGVDNDSNSGLEFGGGELSAVLDDLTLTVIQTATP